MQPSPTTKFDQLHAAFRWSISIVCALVLALLLYLWILLARDNKLWAMLIFFVVPAIQFLITPLFRQLGFYKYYSPMVVSFGSNGRYLDLHNGSSFDYLFEMRDVRPGVSWKKRMLRHYLEALATIIQKIEQGEFEESIVIRGSSYFVSQRTADRLGFRVSRTSMPEKINIVLNYLDLVWMYSMANGRLTLPNLANISTARTSGAELMKHRNAIYSLLDRINGHRPSHPQ